MAGSAATSSSRSVSSSSARRLRSTCARAACRSASTAAPGRGDADEGRAAVGGVGDALGVAGLGQAVDQHRHAGLGHGLARREVGHAQRPLGLQPVEGADRRAADLRRHLALQPDGQPVDAVGQGPYVGQSHAHNANYITRLYNSPMHRPAVGWGRTGLRARRGGTIGCVTGPASAHDDLDRRVHAALLDARRPAAAADAADAALLTLFDAMAGSRLLDIHARRMREHGRGYYTIGSAGHESNAYVAEALRPTDPALLHYRSGGFFLARSMQAGRSLDDALRAVLLSMLASTADRASGGRHKVLGDAELAVIPQTSTIASHLPRALGVALAISRAKRLGVPLALAPRRGHRVQLRRRQPQPLDRGRRAERGRLRASRRACRCRWCSSARTTASASRSPTPRGWVERAAQRPGITYLAADGDDPDGARAAAARGRRPRPPRPPAGAAAPAHRALPRRTPAATSSRPTAPRPRSPPTPRTTRCVALARRIGGAGLAGRYAGIGGPGRARWPTSWPTPRRSPAPTRSWRRWPRAPQPHRAAGGRRPDASHRRRCPSRGP